MSMDVHELFESQIPQGPAQGPAQRPVEDRLAAGRVAVRRRRLAVGASALATITVVGVGAVAVAGRHDGPRTAQDPGFAAGSHSPSAHRVKKPAQHVSSDPRSTTPDYHLTADGTLEPPIFPEDYPARYDGDRLVAKPGGHVVTQLDDVPFSTNAVPPGSVATAVTIEDGDGVWYVRGYVAPDGTHDILTEPAGLRADSLATWVTKLNAAQSTGAGAR